MTKEQFITSVEEKPRFIKWVSQPSLVSTIGDIQRWAGKAYTSTPDGNHIDEVSFFVDALTGDTVWAGSNQIAPDENSIAKKYNALKTYLNANFAAYFIGRTDLENNWVEADVFIVSGADLSKSTVLVFKNGNNPIAHKKIV